MARKMVRCPLYGIRVTIFSTAQDYEKYTGDKACNDYVAMTNTLDNVKTGVSMVAVVFYSPKDFTCETLTHECVHAAWRILNLVGVKVTYDNNEPLAYVTGWLAQEVNNFMIKVIDDEQRIHMGS